MEGKNKKYYESGIADEFKKNIQGIIPGTVIIRGERKRDMKEQESDPAEGQQSKTQTVISNLHPAEAVNGKDCQEEHGQIQHNGENCAKAELQSITKNGADGTEIGTGGKAEKEAWQNIDRPGTPQTNPFLKEEADAAAQQEGERKDNTG